MDETKSPRRSPRNFVEISSGVGDEAIQKTHKRSRLHKSTTDIDVPSFDLGISQSTDGSGNVRKNDEQSREFVEVLPVKLNKAKKKRAKAGSTSKPVVASDDDFVEVPPKVVQQTKKRRRNRISKDTPLPEDADLDRKFWRHPNVTYCTSRWQSYTNHNAIDQIKAVLSDKQLELFRETCFGQFLDMPKANTQLQLIHCLMNKELKHTPNDVFAVELNGYQLFFGLREFAIVTGLNCISVGNFDSVPETSCKLMSSYFPGQKSVQKNDLRAQFLSKKFLQNDDAVGLAVLFFIHDFLFSYENSEQQISKKDFYLVDTGLFNSYHWGLDVYSKLLESVRHSLRSSNKYYRIGGLPLALQVWIYECCSSVDEDIAICRSSSIPRILRWQPIAECPWQKHIENGIFLPSKNKFANIVPIEEEIFKFRLPEPRDYNAEILKLEPAGSSHCLNFLTNEVYELRKELVKVNENHKSLEEKVEAGFVEMKRFIIDSHTKLLEDMKLLFAKASDNENKKSAYVAVNEVEEPATERKNGSDAYDPCQFDIRGVDIRSSEYASTWHHSQSVEKDQLEKAPILFASDVVNSEGVAERFDEDPSGIAIGQVLAEVAAASKVKEFDDDVVEKVKLDDHVAKKDVTRIVEKGSGLDDFVLFDSDLSQICKAEAAYLEEKRHLDEKQKEVTAKKKKKVSTRKQKKVTPEKQARKKIPGRLVTSPYLPEFDSGGTICVTRQIFQIKHPFSFFIGLDVDPNLISSFTSWLNSGLNKRRKKNPYSADDNIIEPKYELGICKVDRKDWFYKMAQSGQQWCDEHIDVILYYLRKKGKYGPNDIFSFTTTDCCFKTKVCSSFFQMCDAQFKKQDIKVKLSDTIVEYMSGRRLLASSPWHEVNFILIPINIKENHHWIFVVFDIIKRTLLVYDSFPSRGVNHHLDNVVGMLAAVLPYYLSLTKFCDKRSDLCPCEYDGKTVRDPLKVKKIIEGVPTQSDTSLDCGVFVAAFAELASNGQEITNQKFDGEILRKRFGALLWHYAKMKQDLGVQSEDERPKRL